MRILYFAAIDFFSKPNPSYHLMTSMLTDLLNANHKIYYVGIEDVSVEKHIPECLLDNPNYIYELIKVKPAPKNNFPLRYLNGLKYALKARKQIKAYINNCDVVFIQSSPTALYNILVVSYYKKDQRIIYNVQDMFPGSSIASGVMPNKLMQSCFYGLQRIAYRKSDLIVGISEDMRDKIIEQGVPYDKTEVVLNWFDDKSVHYVSWEDNRFVKKRGMSKDTFYIQYAGTMGYVFDYKIVLKVAQKLYDYKDIEIQMIGMGSQKEAFIKEATALGLDNIKFLPLEPQEMVSDVYSACSVCYIPLKHGIIGNSVPSKAGLLMACHKPIITSADKNSKYNEEINSNRIGIACSDDDPDSVVDAILQLYNNPELAHQMGENGYNYGHDRYSRSYNMNKYLNIFTSL